MALFGKNPNEVAYTGGKKHWADVIKNTGPGELLIWRQPEEDFNTNSTSSCTFMSKYFPSTWNHFKQTL